MSEGETDNPGIKVPPPLIYLLPLLLGLILDRKAHLPFLPSSVVRIIGWSPVRLQPRPCICGLGHDLGRDSRP